MFKFVVVVASLFSSRVYAFVVNNFRGHIPLKEKHIQH